MACSPGRPRPRWPCRARKVSVPWPPSGRRRSVAAPGNPDASGDPADLPPPLWACAQAGSKGPKKSLINISASLFAQPGTSPDIPVAVCTQIRCIATDSAAITSRHPPFRVAPFFKRRTRSGRVHSGETCEQACPVGTLRTTQWWHPRSWRKSGRRARLKPGCPLRACRFKSCRAHFVVSSVRDGNWETCRIQTPVPSKGVQVRLLPDVHIAGRW